MVRVDSVMVFVNEASDYGLPSFPNTTPFGIAFFGTDASVIFVVVVVLPLTSAMT